MRRHARMFARVICANRVGTDVLRVAVLVTRGKTVVERVAIVDVNRKRTAIAIMPMAEALEVAKDSAMYPSLSGGRARIVATAFDGEAFTGIDQPLQATAGGF